MATAISTTSRIGAIERRPTLQSAGDEQIFDALEAFFLAFGTDAKRLGERRVALYVDACRGEPIWAVNEGIRKLRLGLDDGRDTDFLPSTRSLSREVRGLTATMREQAERKQSIAAENRRAREEYEEGERARRDETSQATRDRLAKLVNNAVRAV